MQLIRLVFNVNSLIQEHAAKQLDNRSWEDSYFSLPGKKDLRQVGMFV